ncbi:DUF1405 domain-containing protein [Halococcus sp. AFM35]|uniref:DUF1405 domain-containing protein n=1 Tax=Halococcus sp. AFM35 TaxID=3421653 RepID=UPI003EBC7F01
MAERRVGPLGRLFDGAVPDREALPWYVAPVPRAIEDLGLRLAWLVVAVNLAGTAFGFFYYRFQFGLEPVLAWPFVPDSPLATLFIALSIASWKRGHSREWLNALAFFGCLKLGLWTPYTLLVFHDSFLATTPTWLYLFLLFSHLAMAVQAFVIHRYAEFPVWAVAVALAWYGLNDLVDYFVPVVGTPHHTTIPVQPIGEAIGHVVPAHQLVAAGALALTLLATFLALATRVNKLEARSA